MNDEVPLLDQEVLAELRASTGDDDEFVRELIDAYVAEAAGHFDGMAKAIESDDIAAIVRPAHTLKSSSASVGAMRLAGICRAIEEAARENRRDGLDDQVRDAQATWTATLDALQAAGLTS
jgi:HPt (histidine-containing phosphotransfer) domain-containing protein